MDLILWRHAEAEAGSLTLSDGKRRLTERGQKQAKAAARWLSGHLPKNTRVLVSPSERTQQTAHALHWPYEIEPAVNVGCDATDVLNAAGWPDAPRTTLIIGHQPTLGQLAARLLSGTEQDWAVKKGAIWWFSWRVRENDGETILRAVLNPDFL